MAAERTDVREKVLVPVRRQERQQPLRELEPDDHFEYAKPQAIPRRWRV